jgi:hypothetical protein
VEGEKKMGEAEVFVYGEDDLDSTFLMDKWIRTGELTEAEQEEYFRLQDLYMETG